MIKDLQLQILSLEYAIASTQQRIGNGEKLERSLSEYLEMLGEIEELVREKRLLNDEAQKFESEKTTT